MPNAHDVWFTAVKKYLQMKDSNPAGKMSKRRNEIQQMVDSTTLDIPQDLSQEFEELKKKVKALRDGEDQEDPIRKFKESSRKMRLLKKEIRIVVALQDPAHSPKAKAEALKVARFKPLYTGKRELVERTLERMKEMPGAGAKIKTLEGMLKEAEDCGLDYEAALKAVSFPGDSVDGGVASDGRRITTEGAGVRALLKEAEEDSRKFKAALKDVPEVVHAEEFLARYEALAGNVDPDGVIEGRKALDDAYKIYDADRSHSGLLRTKADMNVLIKKYKPQVEKQEALQKRLAPIVKEITEELSKAAAYAPLDELANVRGNYEFAKALIDNQRLEDAEPVLTNIQAHLSRNFPIYKQAFNRWHEHYSEKLEKYQETVRACVLHKVVLESAPYLHNLIERRIKIELLSSRQFAEACKLVDDENLFDNLEKLEKWLSLDRDAPAPQIKTPGLTAKKEFQAKKNAPLIDLADIQTKLEALKAAGIDVTGLEKSKQELDDYVLGGMRQLEEGLAEDAWTNLNADFKRRGDSLKRRMAEAEEPEEAAECQRAEDEFREAASKDLKDIEAALQDIEERVGDAAAFRKQLENLKKLPEEWIGKRRLEEKLDADQFRKSLRDFRNVASLLKQQIAPRIPAAWPEAFEAARKKAKALQQELEREKNRHGLADDHPLITANPDLASLRAVYEMYCKDARDRKGYSDMNSVVGFLEKKKDAIQAAVGEMDAVRKKAREIADGIEAAVKTVDGAYPKYQELHKHLRYEVQQLLDRADSLQLAEVLKSKSELEKLVPPNPADYQKVEDGLAAASATISKIELKEYLPAEQQTLQIRLENEIKIAVYSAAPADAIEIIKKFQSDEIDPVNQRAAAAEAKFKALAKKLDDLKKEVEKLAGTAPKLKARLATRLRNVVITEKPGVNRAEVELNGIDILVRQALQSPGSLERKAEIADFEDERQKAAFEASQEVFERLLRGDADRVKSEIKNPADLNKGVYDKIGRLAKHAEKLADKKDYLNANEELMRAANLAKYFIANPLNRPAAARKELGRANAEYKKAVGAYVKQLSVLEEALKVAKDEHGVEVDTASAQKLIRRLFGLFGAGAFDGPIEVLKKDAGGSEQQRQARELALRRVRLAQKALASNPLVERVVDNPIAPVSVVKIHSTLRKLSAALLVS